MPDFGFDAVIAGYNKPTSLQFVTLPTGEDLLITSQQDGTITVWLVESTGAGADKDFTATEVFSTEIVNTILNHNDNGEQATNVNGRQVTGLTAQIDPDTGDIEVYLMSSDPRIGGGGGDSVNEKNLDTNSGVLSKLTFSLDGSPDGGAWSVDKIDLLRGLPRSEENHSPNGLDFTPDGKLLIIIGGFANAGAPSQNLGYTPEYFLSGTILEVDVEDLEGRPTLQDSEGQFYKYDLPTLGIERGERAGDVHGEGFSSNPDNPFGGNDGYNQAYLEAGGPVSVFATGFRNGYDIEVVVLEPGDPGYVDGAADNFRVYVWDNGANNGWGEAPMNAQGHAFYSTDAGILILHDGSTEQVVIPRADGSIFVDDGGPGGDQTGVYISDGAGGEVFLASDRPDNIPLNENNNPVSPGSQDQLHLVERGGYYGSPNLNHANPDAILYLKPEIEGGGLDGGAIAAPEFVDGAGNLVATLRDATLTGDPLNGFEPSPLSGFFLKPKTGGESPDGALVLNNASTNGIVIFNYDPAIHPAELEELDGDLFGVGFDESLLHVDLSEDGTTALNRAFIEGGGEFQSSPGGNPLDVTIGPGGSIWVAAHGGSNIFAFVPGGTPVGETDNDDSDDLLDVLDPFQFDPDNGLGANSAVAPGEVFEFTMENEIGPPNGITGFALGFTGHMLDYDTEYFTNTSGVVAGGILDGGIAGKLQIEFDAVGDGTAANTANTLTYALQAGINYEDASRKVLLESVMTNVWTGSNEEAGQAQGIYFGTGTQFDYAMFNFALDADGDPVIQITIEINDVVEELLEIPAPGLLDVPDSDLLMRVIIDRVDLTAQAVWTYETASGPVTDSSAPIALDIGGSNSLTEAILGAGQGGFNAREKPINGEQGDEIFGNLQTQFLVPLGLAVGLNGRVEQTSAEGGEVFTPEFDNLLVTTSDADGVFTPDARGEDAGSVTLGETLLVDVAALLANDSDFQDAGLTITGVTANEGGTAELVNGGTQIAYTPGALGDSGFTYTVSNGTLTKDAVASVTVLPASGQILYRVNAGGPEVAALDGGPVWSADTAANNSPFLVEAGTNSTFPGSPNPAAIDDSLIEAYNVPAEVLAKERSENSPNPPIMSWAFDVAAGTPVEIRLFFTELFTGLGNANNDADNDGTPAGNRVFDVSVDGAVPPVFDDIDSYVQGGNEFFTSSVLTYQTVSDGTIDLQFLHQVENPHLVGIEIVALDTVGQGPSVSIGDLSDVEGTDLVFALTLSEPAGEPVTIDYEIVPGTAVAGTDYTSEGISPDPDGIIRGSKTIAAGSSDQSITVSAIDNLTQDGDREFTINITNVSGDDAVIGTPSATGTILDDDEPVLTPGDVLFAINAGGGVVDGAPYGLGNVDFAADTGQNVDLSAAGNSGTNTNGDNDAITGPLPQLVFESERWADNFSYDFALPDGDYIVELYFAETFIGVPGGGSGDGVGDRIFDVSVENNLVIDDIDLFDLGDGATGDGTGQPLVQFVETFNVNVSDGELNIDFLASANNAKISAIVVREAISATDPAEVSISAPADVSEAGDDGTLTTLVFPVTFDKTPSEAVTVTYDVAIDGTPVTTGATVALGTGDGSISVDVPNDALDNGDEIVTVTLTGVSVASDVAVLSASSSASATVLEDDGADPADIDGDGILNTDDPFAYDGTNGDAQALLPGGEFLQEFETDTSDPFSPEAGFSGILVNSAFDPAGASEADPYGDRTSEAKVDISGGFLNVTSSNEDSFGTGTGADNVIKDNYQSAVDVTGVDTFEVVARADNPFFGAPAPANFASFGITLGAGGVDDWVKLVFGGSNANGGGAGGVRVELADQGSLAGGNNSLPLLNNAPDVVIDEIAQVEFKLTIDKTAGDNGQLTGLVTFFGEDGTELGSITTPTRDIDAGGSLLAALNGENPLTGGDGGLAYGISITDWDQAADEFSASWDFLRITSLDAAAPDTLLSIADAPAVVEAGDDGTTTTLLFDVTADSAVDGDVELELTIDIDGSAETSSQTVTLAGGSGQIEVAVDNDDIDNGPETVTVTLDGVGTPGFAIDGAVATGSGTVTEDDVAPPADVLFRVNVGGPELTSLDGGPNWGADTGAFGNAGNSPYLFSNSSGGSTYNGNSGSAHPGAITADGSVPATTPIDLFNTERYDLASTPEQEWRFPVEAGTTVEVRLYFAELFGQVDQSGERVFDVAVEGTVDPALDDIDQIAIAGPKGGFMRATTVVVSEDGILDITLLHDVIENPALKGIEIVKIADPVDEAPTLATPIAPQETDEDALFSFIVPAGTFSDDGGEDNLTLAATLDGGSPLPGWLQFDPLTGAFSGTPENGDVGTVVVKVTATDAAGQSAEATFDLTVKNTNDAPVVTSTVSELNATAGTATVIDLSALVTVSDDDPGDVATLNVTPSDPAITFDGTFLNIPDTLPAASYTITLGASDLAGASAATVDLTLVVDPAPDTTPPTGTIATIANLSDPSAAIVVEVTYADDTALDTASIDEADLTLSGPGLASGVNATTVAFDAGTGVATYTFASPAGGWQQGTFDVALAEGAVVDQAGNEVPAASASVTVDVPLSVSLLQPATTALIEENEDALLLVVQLSEAASEDMTVTYDITGTAADGIDYRIVPPFEVEIEAGESQGTLILEILNDEAFEGLETLSLSLTSTSEGSIDTSADTIDFTIESQDPDSPPTGDPITLEAEDFTGVSPSADFFEQASVDASGNALIRVRKTDPVSVDTELPEDITPGVYTIAVTYFDEGDGESQAAIAVDGTQVGAWTLDNDGPFNGAQGENLRTVEFDNVVIGENSILTLSGQRDGDEFIRIDKLTFTRTGDEPSNQPPTGTDIPDLVEVDEGAALSLPLAYTDPEGELVTVTAALSDATPLPDWLSLTPTGLEGTPPPEAAGQSFEITVTASDPQGGVLTDTFTLQVNDITGPTSIVTANPPASPADPITVDVVFSDASNIEELTIDINDVTLTGPDGLVVASGFSYDASTKTATFSFDAPLAGWTSGDYTAELIDEAVTDTAGNDSQPATPDTIAVDGVTIEPGANLDEDFDGDTLVNQDDSDIDADGVTNLDDRFAYDDTNVGVDLSAVGQVDIDLQGLEAGDSPFTAGFTGLMPALGAVDELDYSTNNGAAVVDTPNGKRLQFQTTGLDTAEGQTAFTFGAQVGDDFTFSGTFDNPYFGTGETPDTFEQYGLILGFSGADFLKLVAGSPNSAGGGPGFEISADVGGAGLGGDTKVGLPAGVAIADYAQVELTLTGEVTPGGVTLTGTYTLLDDTGQELGSGTVGSKTFTSGPIFDAITADAGEAVAFGVTSTHFGGDAFTVSLESLSLTDGGIDVDGPTALVEVADLPDGDADIIVEVTYTDDSGIDAASVDGDEIVLTSNAGDTFPTPTVTDNGGGSYTYTFAAPAGGWQGTSFTAALSAGTLADASPAGNLNAAGTPVSFTREDIDPVDAILANLTGVDTDGDYADGATGSVILTIMDGVDNVKASNFGNNSFQLYNTGDKQVAAVFIDFRDAIYGDSVVDFDGTAGDTTAKPFVVNSESGNGTGGLFASGETYFLEGNQPVPNTSGAGNAATGGFRGLLLKFDGSDGGFETGEFLGFSGDMDPNSLAGLLKSGPLGTDTGQIDGWDVGGVSGAELVGSKFIVVFDDGSTAEGYLHSDGSLGGSVGEALEGRAATPVTVTVNGFAAGDSDATYGATEPVIIVTGTPGDTVRVVMTQGLNPVQNPNGGVADIVADRLEATQPQFQVNNAANVQTVDLVIGADGTATVPAGTFDYNATPNNVDFPDISIAPMAVAAAVIEDSTDPSIVGQVAVGPVSAPVYLTNPTGEPVDPDAGGTVPFADVDIADQTISEDETYSFSVPANAFDDADGDTLTLTGVDLPDGFSFDGSTVTAPAGLAPGDYDITIQATDDDGNSAQQTYTVTVEAVPDSDIIISLIDPATDEVIRTLSDADLISSSELSTGQYSVAVTYDGDGDESVHFIIDGQLAQQENFLPYALFGDNSGDYNGSPLPADGDSYELTVNVFSGGSGSGDILDSRTITLFFGEGEIPNRAPEVVNPIADEEVAFDGSVSIDVTSVFTDPDDDILTLGAAGLPDGVTFDGSTISGQPTETGTFTITVSAFDGEFSAQQSFELIVLPEGGTEPFVDFEIPDQTIQEDEAFSLAIPANAFDDLDGDALTLTVPNPPDGFSFDNGVVSAAPGLAVGDYDITVVATDDDDNFVQQTFTVTVVPEPDTVPFVNVEIGDQVVEEGEEFSFAIPMNAFDDLDGDALTLTVPNPPAGFSFDNGVVSAAPGLAVGDYDITVVATDDDDNSVQQTFTVSVVPPNLSDIKLFLIDPDTDEQIRELSLSDIIATDELPDGEFNLQAVYTPGGEESAIFYINGEEERTESGDPYAIFSDAGGNFNGDEPPSPGTVWSVTVEIYSENSGNGILLATETFTLTFAETSLAPLVQAGFGPAAFSLAGMPSDGDQSETDASGDANGFSTDFSASQPVEGLTLVYDAPPPENGEAGSQPGSFWGDPTDSEQPGDTIPLEVSNDGSKSNGTDTTTSLTKDFSTSQPVEGLQPVTDAPPPDEADSFEFGALDGAGDRPSMNDMLDLIDAEFGLETGSAHGPAGVATGSLDASVEDMDDGFTWTSDAPDPWDLPG